ncbi:ParB/RepB/Spo0J family partition protein [Azospirillum thermophilum]|uniref:ParB/Sulfiredoxin domain-containing protein n=1 Tax=Azospirillum thermophilum TaxID=2202148 RepID=A0A2S2D0W6_9PROT|nr:ParB/RepB/Spo0J family partition protein [Azospirillum thermophilum]AWK90328.1 hypothetical protein DEW08_30395 [Azospirillum thermophilum]
MPDTTLLISPLAASLFERMRAAGMGIPDLAKAAGIPKASLERLFVGMATDLPAAELGAVAAFFGVEPEALTQAVQTGTGLPAKSFRGERVLLPLRVLRRSSRNPRKHFDPETLRQLADSIRSFGILQNLVVRHDPQPGQPEFVIVAGERRFRAASLLAEAGDLDPDQPIIPVAVVDADDARHTAMAILENLQREAVHPLDEAQGFADLIALDPDRWRPSTIAQEIGCSARHVQLRVGMLQKLCDQAQRAMRAGLLTVSQAYVLGTASHARQAEVLRHIDRYQTLQQLRDAVTDGLVPVTRAKFDLDGFAGRIITLDNGARYFADREEFLAAQRAAGKSLADAMAEAWAWAEFLEDGWFPANRFEPERSDEAGAGVLVLMHPITGVITIHDELLPRQEQARPAPAPAPAPEPETWTPSVAPQDQTTATQAPDATQRRRDEEQVAQLRQSLADRIAKDSRTALALLLADALRSEEDAGVLERGPSDDPGLPASLCRSGGPLATLGGDVMPIGRGRVAARDEEATGLILSRLMSMPMLQLLEAFAAWVADHLATPAGDLSPALRELARGYGIATPGQPQQSADQDAQDLVDRARQPDPAPDADLPLLITYSGGNQIDGRLMERFAVAVAPFIDGQRSVKVTLPDSKIGLQLSRCGDDESRYEISSYIDQSGCHWSHSCMSKTRVVAFLREWLRKEEAERRLTIH